MPAKRTAFHDALNKASNAAWDRRWDAAVREYRRALAESPDDASAHAGLALALRESSQLEAALSEYRLLVQLQASDPAPLAQVADLLERLDRKGDAVAAYSELADTFRAQKQMSKAVEAWRKASLLDPDRVAPHEQLAAAFAEAGHNAPAAREWLALARIAQRSGDTGRARECVERALALEADNLQAKFLLDELEGRGPALSGQSAASPVEQARRGALARLAASVLDDATPWRRDESGTATAGMESLLARAIDAQADGQAQEAIRLYEELVANGSSRPEVLFNLAILYQNSLRHDEAIALLKQTAHVPQFTVASHFALGQSYRAQDKVDDALDHYIQAMKIVDLLSVTRSQADQVIRLYQSLSDSYRAKGDDESARRFSATLLDFLSSKGWQDKVRDVREHIALAAVSGTPLSMQEVFEAPDSERVIELLRTSGELLRAGKLYAAGELAYEAIELAPNYLPAHMQVAEVAAASGRIAEALDKYDMLAETAEVRRDLPKALAFYRQALKLGPDDVTRRAKLIDVLMQSGQLAEALSEYEQIGRVLSATGQYQKAADAYAEGLRLATRAGVGGATALGLRRHLADAYLRVQDWDRALPLYQELQTRGADDLELRLALVELYLRVGRAAEAEGELERALEQAAANPGAARAALSGLAAEFSNHVMLQRQIARYYAATGDVPRAVETLDSLGERLLSSGRSEEAVVLIQDIIALNPPQVNDYRRLLFELREPQAGPV